MVDTLVGGSGNSILVGGAGDDLLRGRSGEDILHVMSKEFSCAILPNAESKAEKK